MITPRVRVWLNWVRFCVGLVEWTGKQLRPGKRDVLANNAPSALAKLDVDRNRWTTRVRGIGTGGWRLVGDAGGLMDVARRMGQRWIKGMGLARRLVAAD